MLDTKILERIEQAVKDRDSEALKKLAAIETNTKATDERIAQLEQKMLDGGRPSARGGGKSLGDQFVESESFKALAAIPDASRGKLRADVIVKTTLTSLTTDAAGSVGAGIFPTVDPQIHALPLRRPVVRDLLPQIQMSGSSVEVVVQKGRTSGAGMVAEGGTKPESDVQLELKTFPARVIAHWIKASRQVLDDVPQLRGLINSELLDGLKLKEEDQLLNGDNTGQNLYGMIPQATAYSAPISIQDLNKIDVIGLAMLQSALAEYPPDGTILHPSDWLEMRLMKDSAGRYLFGAPGAEVVPRLFGAPVIPTKAIAVGKFLVGQFQVAATIYDRWAARVEVATENDQDFVKNLLTLLGEERLAFAVKRPLGLTYGDFAAALAI